jgi:hypothetical protein
MSQRPSALPSWRPIGRTSNTSYYWAPDDMLIVLPDTGLKDDETSARENVAYQKSLARTVARPVGLVVYLGALLGQDPAARRIYAELDPTVFLGSALVVSSPLARAIGSFFMGLSRPRFPARLVENIDDGLRWLATLRKPS